MIYSIKTLNLKKIDEYSGSCLMWSLIMLSFRKYYHFLKDLSHFSELEIRNLFIMIKMLKCSVILTSFTSKTVWNMVIVISYSSKNIWFCAVLMKIWKKAAKIFQENQLIPNKYKNKTISNKNLYWKGPEVNLNYEIHYNQEFLFIKSLTPLLLSFGSYYQFNSAPNWPH